MSYKTEGKYRPTKLDPDFLIELAHLQEIGDEKHKDHHWRDGVSVSAMVDAIKRHTQSIERGEYIDPDTGIPHSSAIACTCMYISFYTRNLSTYRPFFDLPFAGGHSNLAKERVPGSYAEGSVNQAFTRSSGTIRETERSRGTSGRLSDHPGSILHGEGGPGESDMG